MKKIRYLAIEGRSAGFNYLALLFLAMTSLGIWAFFHLEHTGHAATGMDNQIVWGLPHVFAILLIVAASGALNLASIGTVFNKGMYKPLARISAWLSIALLIGGVIVLVLDLGNPFHVDYMITSFNTKSIFAWNIVLYPGFLLFTGVYLWTMLDTSVSRFYKSAGTMAFIWRIVLTTGTGSIFGFLVGRAAYDAPIMAPLFIVTSFAVGLAFFLITLMASYRWAEMPLGDALLKRLKNLLVVFIAVVFYFTVVYHLTNSYATEHHGLEKWILGGSSIYTKLFWYGQIILGTLLPLIILLTTFGNRRSMILLSSLLVIIGTFCQFYIIVIGGQAYPQQIMGTDWEVLSSSFADAAVYHSYTPSIWELMLGIGGLGLAFLMVLYGFKLLRFLPESLADKDIDPHAKTA